jgi:hypothetical protein
MMKRINSTSRVRRLSAIILLSVLFGLLFVVSSGARVVLADGTPPPPQPVETPKPPQPPEGGSTSVFVSSVTNIFHHLVFPAETISEALGNIFMKAATENEKASLGEISTWTSVLADVIHAPARGSYTDVARSSLPVAGSLAVGLFVLRLAMYHWNRLLGESDTPLQVLGDWLTAGVLAIACGPFLDMIVRLGWWMMAAVLGETSSLAVKFVGAMASASFTPVMINPAGSVTFIQGLMSIALALGALLAVAGLIFAFGVAQATLFVLAVLGPSFAVASVVPEMRWLRSLWIKGVVLVAIMPIMAGGIFKAGILASTYLVLPGGILAGIIRILWLFGAAGMLMTMTGILGRITLGSAAETLGKMWDAAKGIVGTVALVGAGVATGGAALAGEGAVLTSSSGTALTGGSSTALAGGGETVMESGLGGAMNSLGKANTMNTMSTLFSSMGLPKHAQIAGGLARGHEIEARSQELSTRIGHFNQHQSGPSAPEVGVSGIAPRVAQAMLDNFGGSADDFKQVFPAIESRLRSSGLEPGVVANQYPRELGSMAKLYRDNPDYYNSSPDMLVALSQDAMASGIQSALMGRPNSQ